jgi:Flp pilus assembly protein TadD
MSALAATALALCLAPLAAEAKQKPKPEPAAQAGQAGQAADPAAAPRAKATREERAMTQRLDPLARAAFWARESDLDPNDLEAGLAFAQALRDMGNFEDAVTAAQRVTALAPQNIDGWLAVARAQIARNQGFYAIEPAKRAMALAPRDWRPVSLLAVAYEQASRDDEALAAHRKAMELAPDNPAVLSNAAMYYAGHGDAAQAEKLLRVAAAKPDASIQVRQNLTLVLGLEGRFDEAERLARQDLPPEVVANNMAYLRSVGPGGPIPVPSQRSWNSVRGAP